MKLTLRAVHPSTDSLRSQAENVKPVRSDDDSRAGVVLDFLQNNTRPL